MAGRRGNNEGCIYQRSDDTWCGMVTVGRDAKTGKLKRVTFYGKSRPEVAEKIIQAQSEINKNVFVEPSRVKVNEWLDTWLNEYMKPSLRPTTYSSYEHIIRTHIKPEFNNTLLRELRPEKLQKFYNEKHKNGRLDGTGGLSSRSVRYIHIIIHEALQQAMKNQLVVRNVSEATTLPRQSKKDIRVFSVEEQLKFLDVAENDDWGMAFKLDLASGLRLGELLALRWSDVDFTEGLIRVRNSIARVKNFDIIDEKGKYKTGLVFQEPKTKSGKRNIPLPASILEDLQYHRKVQDKDRAFMGEAYVDNDLVFCTQFGTPIEPRNMMRRFYNLVEDAGVDRTNFHAMRHSFATRALEAGIHPKVVQEILGHANIAMTLDIYSHVMPELKKSAADKLNHLFDRNKQSISEQEEPIEQRRETRTRTPRKEKEMEFNL